MSEVSPKGENIKKALCASETKPSIFYTSQNTNWNSSHLSSQHLLSNRVLQPEDKASSNVLLDDSFVFPVEVWSSAPPSAREALKCLFRKYLSEHLEEFFRPLFRSSEKQVSRFPVASSSSGSTYSCSSSADIEILSLPSSPVLSRTSLLVPILSTAPRPLLQYIHSARLGEYGPLSLLSSYFSRSILNHGAETKDPFSATSLESEMVFQSREDQMVFMSFLKENISTEKIEDDSTSITGREDQVDPGGEFFPNLGHKSKDHPISSTLPTSTPLPSSRFQQSEKNDDGENLSSGAFSCSEKPDGALQGRATEGGEHRMGNQMSSYSFYSPTVDSFSLPRPIYDILFFDLHTKSLSKSDEDSSSTDSSDINVDAECEDEESVCESSATRILPLPHAQLEGLWESLLYGQTLHASRCFKVDLLKYMQTSLLFSFAGVNPHLIHWSRLILLFGPPGTGKTSLCKAVAHKLSILLHRVFPCSVLVEINSPQVFSRWFSESGKQVMKTFLHIQKLASDRNRFVCVLMDEVESLVMARHNALQGNEPSDALRVVNVILTQLDALQRCQNVLLLATSNMVETIDSAFLDRVDKKVYVGPPGRTARRAIIRSSVVMLLEKQLVAWSSSMEEVTHLLHKISTLSEGLSGRFLRKVSFLAFHHVYDFSRSTMRHYILDGRTQEAPCFNPPCSRPNKRECCAKHPLMIETSRCLDQAASVNLIDFLRAILLHVQNESSCIAERQSRMKRSRQEK